MGWNGSGTFNRIYSWVADKAAGLDISSTRMDTDTNDIAANGFGNCLTRDGQGPPSANLPMAGFRHTGVQNAVSRSDYSAFGQVQDGLPNWTVAGGTADALTATYTPALTVLADGQLCFLRAGSANATTTPTFAPNGLTARTITKLGGGALAVGDIAGSLAEIVLRYNVANTRWELLNPSNNSIINSVATTGTVALTFETTAPAGWLLFDDGTFGSATSGSSNSNSAANQALFTLLFNNVSDANAPILTSGGGGTTRAGQGTAAAAWAANCRMTLPKTLGRALAVAGTGSGLTARALGSTTGTETVTVAQANLPSLNFTVTDPSHTHAAASWLGTQSASGGGNTRIMTTGAGSDFTSTPLSWSLPSATTGISVASGGSGTALANVQPSSFLNAKVKQ